VSEKILALALETRVGLYPGVIMGGVIQAAPNFLKNRRCGQPQLGSVASPVVVSIFDSYDLIA